MCKLWGILIPPQSDYLIIKEYMLYTYVILRYGNVVGEGNVAAKVDEHITNR